MSIAYTAYIFHSPHEYEHVSPAADGSGLYKDSGYIYNGQIVIYVGDDTWSSGGTTPNKAAVIKWYDLRSGTWKLTNGCESYNWNDADETRQFRILKDFNTWCDGRLINITRMNDVIYGSNYYSTQSGGSHYTLRSNTYIRTATGTSTTIKASSKGVAFGKDQGYLLNNSIASDGTVWIRMYGYYLPDGTWHETSKEYIVEFITNSPSLYSINTF